MRLKAMKEIYKNTTGNIRMQCLGEIAALEWVMERD